MGYKPLMNLKNKVYLVICRKKKRIPKYPPF